MSIYRHTVQDLESWTGAYYKWMRYGMKSIHDQQWPHSNMWVAGFKIHFIKTAFTFSELEFETPDVLASFMLSLSNGRMTFSGVMWRSCHSTIDKGSVKLAEASSVSKSGSEKVNSIYKMATLFCKTCKYYYYISLKNIVLAKTNRAGM